MTINLEFTAPYDGTIYSKSNGQSQRCVHVAPHSHITEATFSIDYQSCGTRSDSQGKFYENTIIIQYDDIVIEAWDEAKKIRCEWHDGYEKSAYKMPITISDLDVVEMNFQGDDVDCWLEVQDGKGPWSAKVEGLVPLGSPLTLVVAIQDSEGQFDMRVKSCIAHDGHKHPIHLTDEDGCVLRSKMMSPFQKTLDTKGTASVIAYSHFYAFKFPESVEVTIQCTVEICRHGCPDTCLQGRDAQTSSPGEGQPPAEGKDDDVPTYKDSHPFSTVITSKSDKSNHSSTLNTSSIIALSSENNVTKDEPEPLKTSPDTHHDFYMNRYPFDLYDILEADERHDKNENQLYSNVDDEYTENTDDIYFSQTPNVYAGINEQGKNFPTNAEIQNISNKTESYTDEPDILDANSGMVSSTTEKENISLVENLPTAEKFTDSKNENINLSQNELNKKNETTQFEITDQTTENTTTEKLNLIDTEPRSDLKSPEEQTLSQLLSSELFEDSADSNTAEAWEDSLNKLSPTHLTSESLHKSKATGTKIESNSESNDYSDTTTEYKSKLNSYKYGEKRSNEDTLTKNLADTSFEDYKIKARKPLDNNDWRHNIHNFNYRPFMPPAPVPPLTLYNGIPLYYYNHPGQNVEFTDRNGFQYIGEQPFQRQYLKSKLRRPGRRRGRRQIGEKEQLGLKQTLRVVATTDFDFLMKDGDEAESLYVGKPDTDREVCIAPSSFATGLGLLLLANICVLCVVVFLGHHYYIYRKIKVNNTELLCTEMT